MTLRGYAVRQVLELEPSRARTWRRVAVEKVVAGENKLSSRINEKEYPPKNWNSWRGGRRDVYACLGVVPAEAAIRKMEADAGSRDGGRMSRLECTAGSVDGGG